MSGTEISILQEKSGFSNAFLQFPAYMVVKTAECNLVI